MALPTAKFPGAIASVADLRVQADAQPSLLQLPPALTASLDAVSTSFSVTTGRGSQLPTDNFVVSIDDEIIFVGSRSGDTLSNCTRGVDGTTASAHGSGVAVYANIVAAHHNQVAAEVIALEQYTQWLPQLYAPPGGGWVDGIGSGGNGGNTHLTITNRPDRMILDCIPDDTWHIVYNVGLPVPVPPYTVEVAIQVHGFAVSTLSAGVGITDSGATKISMTDTNVMQSSYHRRVYNLTFGHTAAALTDTASVLWQNGVLSFHRITDDGVNRKFWCSANGKDYALLQSRTSGEFLTAAYAGVWTASSAAINSANFVISVPHFRVVNSVLPQFADSALVVRSMSDSQASNWGDALSKVLA